MCRNPFIDCWLWICVAQGLLAHDVGSHSFLQISYGKIILPDEVGECVISFFEKAFKVLFTRVIIPFSYVLH